jgi:hypothetical protein
MASDTGWLKRAWKALLPAAMTGGRVFAVACRCGQMLRGRRTAVHQVLRCPGCGRNVFVLPASAFQPPTPDAPPGPRQPPSALWLLVPILVCGLLAMVVVYALFRNFQPTEHSAVQKEAESPRFKLLAQIDAAHQQMELAGGLHLARELLDKAVQQRDADPTLLTEAEHRRLNQLQRQAALLTELVPVPLLTLIDQAENAPNPAAWQARCRAYQGKGLIFDDMLRNDRAPGRIQSRRLGDLRTPQMASGRVALEDLTLLHLLPLQMPQRWIFGARIRGIDREGGPGWVIRLEPESGVLFSERTAVEAEMPGLSNDPEWPLLLARQQALLETLPAPRVHRP